MCVSGKAMEDMRSAIFEDKRAADYQGMGEQEGGQEEGAMEETSEK